MFNKEFYPTTAETLDLMQIDCSGKTVYEPQGGAGHIVDYCKAQGAKEVISTEINDSLREILSSKCRVIGKDCFDVCASDISHVDQIIMNPPFSNADKHILHMYEIAPEGCEITSICNWETINSPYTSTRKQLNKLIKGFGFELNIGQQFINAERTTQVEIGLVKIFKPVINDNSMFDGFFMDEDEHEEQSDGIMQFNEVRALVQRYVGAMKQFDVMYDALKNLESNTSILGFSSFCLQVGHNETISNKSEFGKAVQKASWNYIIGKMGVRSMVTSGMLQDINKFVEVQHNVPFTMKNVYHMIDLIIQTREQNFNKSLVKTVDDLTRYTHENRFSVEGWKTNESHMLGKKVIIERMCDLNWDGTVVEIGNYNSRSKAEKMDDLIKVLCFLNGEKYQHELSFSYMKNLTKMKDDKSRSYFDTGVWYTFHRFFDFKVFKKGSMHLKFKETNDWYLLNQRYGELKGFNLPEKFKK